MTFNKKEYDKERYQCPEVKERKKEYMKEYNQRPEVKQRIKEYLKRQEIKERALEYNRKYMKEYSQRPEVKERLRKRKDNFERPYFTHSLNDAKRRAKKKFPDKLFNITADYLKEIFPHEELR